MAIRVSDSTKTLLARYGPNKLFGDDVDQRKRLDEARAIALFDDVWKDGLKRIVGGADRCHAEDAYERLTSSQRTYFDHSQGWCPTLIERPDV